MKKMSLFLMVIFSLTICLNAQTKATIIAGTFKGEDVQNLVLLEVKEGEKTVHAKTQLTKDNHFIFTLPKVKEGFYYIADQHKNNLIRLYLKPGDTINLKVDKENYVLPKSTLENTTLKRWTELSYPVTRISSMARKDTTTYRSFFPILTALLPKTEVFKSTIKTPNPAFNELFKKSIDAELEHAALKFLLLPKPVQPSKEEYPDFYRKIVKENKYADPDFLRLGFATELIGFYANHMVRFKEGQKSSVLEVANLFGNGKVKGIYATSQLIRFRTLEELNKEIDPVKQYLITDSMQALYNRLVTKLSVYKKGNPAYNFSFPDLNGNEVSMASLKGKVVLVDLWATWCAPCRAEIPYLKKLEEEVKDRKIEFVSISIDDEKETWLKSVEKEKLDGVQLFAKGWGKMTLHYDINTIPRFMVFDQEGKIITVDAPRPSDPQLKQLLLEVSAGKSLVNGSLNKGN